MHCVYGHECGQSMAGNSAFVSGSTTFRIETLKKQSRIRISMEGPSLEDFDARESVASWFSHGQQARRPHYKCWPSEWQVTARGDQLT